MTIRSVGIVGHGNFGAFIHVLLARFAPEIDVRIYSSHKEPDGTLFFALEDVAKCDAVVLATPIHAFEETVLKILPLLAAESVIVDVATVKVHTAEILKRLAGTRRYIATHPMFGPESYSKRDEDVTGFRIVITEHTLPDEEYSQLKKILHNIGFHILSLTPEAHDKQLAETLFLTHFIGQIVAREGFVRTEIDTVSFGYLMDAVDSVRHDAALFADVFKFNPYCKHILDRFESGEREVRKLLEGPSV